VFKTNGYHEKEFNMEVLKARKRPCIKRNDNEEDGRNINLSYIKGATEKN